MITAARRAAFRIIVPFPLRAVPWQPPGVRSGCRRGETPIRSTTRAATPGQSRHPLGRGRFPGGWWKLRGQRQHPRRPHRLFWQQFACGRERSRDEARVKFWSEMLLARRVRGGDRAACNELVHAHHAALYRFLLHLARDAHAAEDLTQETFAAAWRNIGGFRGRASLSTWLHRIAYTKFVDWNRRSRRVRPHGPDAAQELSNPGPGPLDNASDG